MDIKLTKRETEIKNLIDKGYNIPEICQLLNLAERTVKSHLNKICIAYGVYGRMGLMELELKRINKINVLTFLN